MKLRMFLCFALVWPYFSLNAQKRAITNDSYKTFGLLTNYWFSPNGKFAYYKYGNAGDEAFGVFDLVQDKKIVDFKARDAFFNHTSDKIVYQSLGDTIVIMDLASGLQRTLPHTEFAAPLVSAKGEDILLSRNETGISVSTLNQGRSRFLGLVDKFQVNDQGTMLVFLKDRALRVINLLTFAETSFGEGEFSNVIFDNKRDVLAFTKKNVNNELHFYKLGWSGSRVIADSHSAGLERNCTLSDQIIGFSPNGKQLFFKVTPKKDSLFRDSDLITSGVTVWGYNDRFIQSNQKYEADNSVPEAFLATVNIENGGGIVQIENCCRRAIGFRQTGNNYVLTSSVYDCRNYDSGDLDVENYYRTDRAPKVSLVSTIDGKETVVNIDPIDPISTPSVLSLSPAEKYITWEFGNEVICYEIATGKVRQFNIPVSSPKGTVGNYFTGNKVWGKDDSSFIQSDNYDLWKIFPGSERLPVCITNNYGKMHKIQFQVVPLSNQFADIPQEREQFILAALNTETMQNGYWTVGKGGKADPIMLSMSDELTGWFSPSLKSINGTYGKIYLITKQTASEPPNVYFSKDLKAFKQISKIEPQKSYNWMSSALISYKLSDGSSNKAILYKPENFDPNVKYPIIFNYYQQRAYELHKFWSPEPAGGNTNIAWYVSNGYIVCVPDIINDKPGKIAQITVDVLESTARYLSQFPWVDSTRMGLQGHSFGGYETLCIATGSKMFAAAQASGGMTDPISNIGNVRYREKSLYGYWEVGQAKMGIGVLPWSHTQTYVENSPVLNADKITVPLLLQYGTDDGDFASQGLEMYNAMRRLRKPTWMLVYNQGHILDSEAKLDFNIRQQQFFDHYLKDKPAPIWMTQGVPYRYKGFRSGLQLDISGKQP